MLSGVIHIFCDEIHLYPFSFAEYYAAVGGERSEAWKDYYTYGGLPHILTLMGNKNLIS